jgi:hypothetical protein
MLRAEVIRVSKRQKNHISGLRHGQLPQPLTSRVERGMSLHKMLRMLTLALGGDGYMCFMGNEFGHPEWVEFPRDENGNDYKACGVENMPGERRFLGWRGWAALDQLTLCPICGGLGFLFCAFSVS